mgnify:CR=1 FL=1
MTGVNITEKDLAQLISGKGIEDIRSILNTANENAIHNQEEGNTLPDQPAQIITTTTDYIVYRAEGSYRLYYISTPALVREAVSRRIKENQRQLGLRQGILIALPNEHDRKAISRLEIKLEHDKGLLERLGI